MCRVIAVSNQKGGVGKTVSCVNLGIGLAQEGKKVLLIDADPQGSLTISLGYEEPDEMEYSLATLMMNIVNDEKLNIEKTILHHKEGVDLIPANIELSAIEVSLVNAMSRELILKSMVDRLREFYDYIIIDCMPSLGMMTINALACADSVLIPVQAAYLPVKGLQQLIKTIGRVKKQLNPKLKIEGILLTMVDNRTNYARDISLMVYDTYSASIKVFGTEIPMSVRASEVSVEGGSIYSYDPKGKAAFAYMALTKEVLKEDKISMHRLDGVIAVLKEHDVLLPREYVQTGESDCESGYRMTVQLLDSRKRPDAVICANNYIAYGCVMALHDRGILIPDEIRVITFDDYPFSQILRPMLSVVDIDVYDMGVQAGKYILQKIRKPNLYIQSHITVPSLIVRGST